jgi:hypothetical protein
MKATGIQIIFLFCLLLLSVESMGQLKNNEKVTPSLKNTLSKKRANEEIQIIITVKNFSKLRDDKGVQILAEYRNTNTALVKIKVERLFDLLDKKEIVFADAYRVPKEEVTTGSLDISLNKLSLIHNAFSDITGDSINVSLKELRFDTSDIDVKGRYFESGVAANVQSSHAAVMATILAGAGNSSQFATGAAPGVNLTSSDFVTLLPNADNVYRQYKISIQNHSYGTGIENYYGADAASYDMTVWNNPTLVHVFSSGNSGTSSSTSGLYSGITGFANLTGSFKMAKNIITVGATDSFNIVAALSSKGPAFDGRVKPDLVAFGEDGSSGAAALTSGTAALIQQAFRIGHNNLPSAALVKASLLNSADDINEKHVDFISGYGSLNAFSAVNTIKENRFFESAVAQGEVKTLPIAVPPNIAQLKITVTWMDTAAIPNATKALVNDVDALLQLPATGESWQPWVLSSYPNKDSLLLPAVRRTDTLNTIEQITLDNPQPGNYLVQVTGTRIQTSTPQAFAVAYQFDTVNNFRWTYPNAKDVLALSNNNILRWQTNISGAGSIDFSTNGIQWQTIAPSVNLATQYFKWTTPDTVATGFLRMNLPSLPAVVSDNFAISNPTSIHVGFNCQDSFLLYWNRSKTAQYQLYQLGEKYLEPLQTVADSFIVLQKQQHPDLFYSVAPLINSKPGSRSFTINYTTQGAGCYIRTFFALLQNSNRAFLTAELGTLYNISEVSFQKITAAGIQTLKTITNPSTLNLSSTDLQLTQGANIYRLQIKLKNGSVVYSDTDLVYYFPTRPVLVYPNPAQHNQPINIIAQDPGIYSVNIYDANGRLVHQQLLSNISQSLKMLFLPSGLYIVKVFDENKKSFAQKLIVY